MLLKPREREQPELNLIPLVDVVLLLLIFCMVTSTFVEQGRIKVQLPQANAVTVCTQVSDPITVTVTAQGEYSVNDRPLLNNSPDTLRAALLKVADSNHKVPVTIRADGRATHQAVVTAMDVVGRLGFVQINIATLNERDGDGDTR